LVLSPAFLLGAFADWPKLLAGGTLAVAGALFVDGLWQLLK
jgi:hypothetical protein